jgi:amino acid transporter
LCGAYFVVVTAIEMMAVGSDATAFHDSPSLLDELGTGYVGAWARDVISLGAAIVAFGCCLACVFGGSCLLYALGRDAVGTCGVGKTTAKGGPAVAATVVAGLAAIVVCAVAFDATAADTFAWSGSIGTLILLVFVRRKLAVPGWQLVFPLGAPALLGYTVYVNVSPYPTSGPGRWFPVVAAGVLLLAVIVVIGAPGYARHMGQRLTGEKLSVEGAR